MKRVSRLCKGYSVVIFCCACPFLSVIITLEVITIERPKFSTGEYVPKYVEQLQQKSMEKQDLQNYNTKILVISVIGATASVIAAITGILSICLTR